MKTTYKFYQHTYAWGRKGHAPKLFLSAEFSKWRYKYLSKVFHPPPLPSNGVCGFCHSRKFPPATPFKLHKEFRHSSFLQVPKSVEHLGLFSSECSLIRAGFHMSEHGNLDFLQQRWSEMYNCFCNHNG